MSVAFLHGTATRLIQFNGHLDFYYGFKITVNHQNGTECVQFYADGGQAFLKLRTGSEPGSTEAAG